MLANGSELWLKVFLLVIAVLVCDSKPQRLYDPYARQILPNSVTPNDLYSAQQNSVQPEPTRRYRRPLIQQSTTESSVISVSRAQDGSLVPVYKQPDNKNAQNIGMPTTTGTLNSVGNGNGNFRDTSSTATEATIGTDSIETTVSTLENISSVQNIVRDTDRIVFPNDYHHSVTHQAAASTYDYQHYHPGNGGGGTGGSASDVRFNDNFRFVPRGCSDESIICATKEDYPEDYVNQLVSSNAGKYTDFFGDDIVPEVIQRVDYPDEEPLCTSKEVVIYPTVGKTKENNWAFIINNANFSQGVRVEQCINPGKPCRMTESFPYGYTTECKQKFIYRHLLALNERGEQVKDLFRLPACCKCIVRSTFSYGSGIFSRSANGDQRSTTLRSKRESDEHRCKDDKSKDDSRSNGTSEIQLSCN